MHPSGTFISEVQRVSEDASQAESAHPARYKLHFGTCTSFSWHWSRRERAFTPWKRSFERTSSSWKEERLAQEISDAQIEVMLADRALQLLCGGIGVERSRMFLLLWSLAARVSTLCQVNEYLAEDLDGALAASSSQDSDG